MEDVVFHYLDLFEALGLQRFHLVGASLGGWIAAEFAVRYPERVKRLVLVDAAGLWLDEAPIPDFFTKLLEPEVMRSLLLHDPGSFLAELLFPREPDDERMEAALKAMQATARLGWNPFMHNPKLKHRLHRIDAPALFIRGESDGLVSAPYLEAYARLLPNARTLTIPAAGHAPHLEQPQALASAVVKFLEA